MSGTSYQLGATGLHIHAHTHAVQDEELSDEDEDDDWDSDGDGGGGGGGRKFFSMLSAGRNEAVNIAGW